MKMVLSFIATVFYSNILFAGTAISYPTGYGKIRFNATMAGRTTQMALAKSGLDEHYKNNISFFLPNGTNISPYSLILNKVSYIGYSSRTDVWGHTTGNKVIYITQPAFAENSRAVMTEIILHEADHHRYGSHSCGTSADIDDNGPFGTTAYDSLKKYHHSTTMSISEKSRAASLAISRALYNMCGNTLAYNRILSAYYYPY